MCGFRYGGLVCLKDGHRDVMTFDELRDPVTGRTRVRKVDCASEHYAVARKYMIRLEQRDLANPDMRSRLAEAAHMSPEEFGREFASATIWGEEQAAALPIPRLAPVTMATLPERDILTP